MAKYIIKTNMDKLPTEIIAALVEARCSIEKVNDTENHNCFDAFRDDYNDSNKVQYNDQSSIRGELLKQLSILESDNVIGRHAREAKNYIMDGDTSGASTQFDYMTAFNSFRKDERMFNAYLKANELLGKLI